MKNHTDLYKQSIEPIDVLAMGITFKKGEKAYKAHYRIFMRDGRKIDVPTRTYEEADNTVDDPNFYVLKAGERTIILYGEQHTHQRFRSLGGWEIMIQDFEKLAGKGIDLICGEEVWVGSRSEWYLRDTLKSLEHPYIISDFPEEAIEKFKTWVRSVDEQNEIELSSFVGISDLYPRETWSIIEMKEVRRNLSAVFRAQKMARNGTVFMDYGQLHTLSIVDVLTAIGYEIAVKDRIPWDRFLTEIEKFKVDLFTYPHI